MRWGIQVLTNPYEAKRGFRGPKSKIYNSGIKGIQHSRATFRPYQTRFDQSPTGLISDIRSCLGYALRTDQPVSGVGLKYLAAQGRWVVQRPVLMS